MPVALKQDDVVTEIGPSGLLHHARSVAGCYVTTGGRNLVDETIDNQEALRDFGGTLDIASYEAAPRV